MKVPPLSETLRKGIHISSLVIPLSYRYLLGYNRRLAFLLLLAAFILSLIMEFYRLWHKTFRKTFYRMFGLVLRRHELKDFTGATYLLFAAMLSVAIFKGEIAFCALVFLSVGDTFAAVIGMNYGRRKFIGMRKSLEGSLGCFVSCLIFGLIFYWNQPVMIVSGSLAAAVAELVNIPVDDNVKIPIASGFAMYLSGVVF